MFVQSQLYTPTCISYAAVSMATPQWYQTPNIVTAAIKLKGIPPDKIGDITARFGEQYCAVYVGGESPDECEGSC